MQHSCLLYCSHVFAEVIIYVQVMLGKDNTEQIRQHSDWPFSLPAGLISCKDLSFWLNAVIFC